MIVDLTLGLNAVIWFAAMITPVYGVITGFKSRRDLMLRASLIVGSLVVLLLALEVLLNATAADTYASTLSMLQGYRPWLIFGVSGAIGLGWALHYIGSAVRKRS
ncbi:hypothetical protein [Shimia sp.]|uniref:hypothetical protein n=1 Tax=Shimia sp. TaxID=1954381 RepID=UPI003B8D589A